MSGRHKYQNGFHAVEFVLIAGAVLTLIVLLSWVWVQNNSSESSVERTEYVSDAETTNELITQEPTANVEWNFEGKNWVSKGSVPDCPAVPYLQSPTDASKATGILYPGQYRGDDYKTHGGFRFDDSGSQAIDVFIPMDANLVAASRYYSGLVSGDVQYFLIFVAPCGVLYRLDHLTIFTDKFQKVLDALPEPKIDDSRTTNFSPTIEVKAGELLATEIGFPGNVFFDFGVQDLRQRNEQSKNSDYLAEHTKAPQYDYYGVCWFNLLPTADAKIVKSLPAGGKEGKVSDYCN